ncbi:hypothetical protein BGZ73_003728 [Actinomortierella ambigua]|nr:hypothetical protein BGZ73_003728 [Actinomortierella ambigua]
MSHQRANSTSSIGDRFPGTTAASAGIDIPQRQRQPSATTAPLSISIPRQRSISSSFTLATSPRSFSTNNVFGANPFFAQSTVPASAAAQTSPFAAAFGPLSPVQATPPNAAGGGLPTAPPANIPVLHRRFSSSFNQLNQMVGSPPNATFQQKDEVRGRRTSMFAGSSPPASMMPPSQTFNPPASSPPSSGEKIGLFRKFSTTGRTAGVGILNGNGFHPLDRNEPGPAAPPASTAPVANEIDHQPRPMRGPLSKAHLGADRPADRPSRSSSPMRSMILNGQMLD